jgi:hypothetical protein
VSLLIATQILWALCVLGLMWRSVLVVKKGEEAVLERLGRYHKLRRTEEDSRCNSTRRGPGGPQRHGASAQQRKPVEKSRSLTLCAVLRFRHPEPLTSVSR